MIGTRLADRYEILEELGRGGMGVVYRARDPLLDRDVAIKVVPPALLTPDTELRFQREAQVVAKMDHPAIVTVYDIGRHEGALYFVMPVVRGTNLRAFLRDRSLTLGEVVDIGIQVADALDYSHAQNVIHRDIKPENIMVLREDGEGVRVRIMDFGLARVSIESQLTRITRSGMLIGTVSYFSPEQVAGNAEVDGRSDIYSFGTVLYECLVGEPPFVGEVQSVLYRIVHENPQPPTSLGAVVDAELELLTLHCLAKDPRQRFQRARELTDALTRYRSKLQDADRARPMQVTSSRTPRSEVYQRTASPFVGREREFAELQTRLNLAVAGECQFVVIAGEAGIGKSRLMEEIENLARARRIRVLHGRFVEQDRSFPYQGFCEAIQEYFRHKESSTSSTELPDISDLAPDLVRLFPVLAEIGDIRSATGSRPSLSGEAQRIEDRTYIFELLARTLTRIAGGKPLVLLLQDLHDAEISVEALQYIVRRLGPTPTLIIGSYRQTEVDRRHPLSRMLDSFHGDRRFSSITLTALTASEHRLFIESIVGGPRLSDATAEKLYASTEGNPFFTRELVRSLIDSGGIAEDEAGELSLSTEMGISSDALPETIQQMVEKQIERLPEDLRDVLSVAALIGRTFEFRDLEALVDDKVDAEDAVDRLLRQGLLEEERESRGDRLTFSSGVVRDVLYATLSRRRRRSLHRRYAEYLEKRHAGRVERVYTQLVHHYSQGDVADKAVEYGFKSAIKSLDAFSSEEAVRSIKAALEFLEDEDWGGDRSVEGEARMLLAAAYRIEGNIEGALREAERGIRIFEREKQFGQAARSLLMAAEMAWEGRRVEETRRSVERGIEVARGLDDTDTLVRLLSLGATVANLRSDYETAREYLDEAERLRPDLKKREWEVPVGGRLVVALSNPIGTSDPAEVKTMEEEEIFANVYERLLINDEQGSLLPFLAESWESLDGGWTFRITLRPDVKFSDGKPVTMTDVKRSFERAILAGRKQLPAVYGSIRGVANFLGEPVRSRDAVVEKTDEVEGIVVRSDYVMDVQLNEPLPIFPSLLTDLCAGITREINGDAPGLIGTGPFRVASLDEGTVVLERSDQYWGATKPALDAIEFRTMLKPAEIGAGFRSGDLDLVRGLLPEDLERVLRDHRMRAGLVELPHKSTCFVLFNSSGPLARYPELRRVLAGTTRTQDLVWRTLGRFAQPATGLIPPGMLGHDPGRKGQHVSRDQAFELLKQAGLTGRIRIKGAVHPAMRERGNFMSNLFDMWSDLGVEVILERLTGDSYLAAWSDNDGLDFVIIVWMADYPDPDNFTHRLFHSRSGILRKWFSSIDADLIIDEARVAGQPGVRETLYRKFENLIMEQAALIPLFHQNDYRLANPKVKGLKLCSSAPYVNYAKLGKAEMAPAAVAQRHASGGIVHVATGVGSVKALDPTMITTTEQAEVAPIVFETLTRVIEGARVVPWLAQEFNAEEGGKRYRFKLREDVRFHDGRRLTARDVRYSFERFLQNDESLNRTHLAPIKGARDLMAGRAGDLEGFRIISASEFTIDLESPLAFFLVLLTNPSTAIVPEGSDSFGGSWRDGCVGTGPFRVVQFVPGQRLELERNPEYWREGYPKSEGLVFTFGLSSAEIVSEFRAGRVSLAGNLTPHDIESLRHDSGFAAGYHEAPRLATTYVAVNALRGPLADLSLRKRLAFAIDGPTIVRRAFGKHIVPAQGLIPPGLLGYDPSRAPALMPMTTFSDPVELQMIVSATYASRNSVLLDELVDAWRKAGLVIKVEALPVGEFEQHHRDAEADLLLSTWVADYPDTDSFAFGMLHSEEGRLGKLCGSKEIDRLIERGRVETDPAARHFIYWHIEEIVARDALVLPLFHPPNYRFGRPELEGMRISSFSYPAVAYDNLRMK
jgi:ABC-type transport system substrate-binding protein